MNIDFTKIMERPRECRDDDDVVETAGKRFLQIWDFMLFHLKLEKAELMVYAIIFAMHKNYHTYFQGTRQYIAKWSNTSVRTVSEALKSLTEKGLIVKCYKENARGWRAVYHINPDALPECEFFSRENKNKKLNAIIKEESERLGFDPKAVKIFGREDEFDDGYPYSESAYDFS